jgi:hypothetical protein
MDCIKFFSKLGFDFNKDFEKKSLIFDENDLLTNRLRNSFFYYNSPVNTNTSFYLITATLENQEIESVRKYVWNKNDADLILYYSKESEELEIIFARYSPKVKYEESKLATFSTTKADLNKIDNIKRWRFDSGAFWFNYSKFIKKSKYKGIDKELVSTLESLKDELNTILIDIINEKDSCNRVVQALVDRTLYIKYLEDNHIINSHFYNHYFDDSSLNYKKLLENNSNSDLNKLFKKIHEIFSNVLFESPEIDNAYLTDEVRQLIANSFNTDLKTKQLRLFDFQFDNLPVEFISYIYEVFLTEKQKKNGIYYTPRKLAQLIVDDVIIKDEIGPILDPSSGSGMFLIVGYQRLLEIAKKKNLEPKDSIEKIRFRTRLLFENIFGIEKELTAQRFTLFSLSLQVFKDINPEDIKTFIANELDHNNAINLFSEYPFLENIKHANSLNTISPQFADKKFSYIVGNPPFFEIKNTEDFSFENTFLKTYEVLEEDKKYKSAKDIVGRSQISQCFFLKIKDWADDKTRFGFVSNSSNFYNDKSEKFQNYFYSNYGIEKIYELSRVKKILFEKAQESVVAVVFKNNFQNDNSIEYFPVKLGLFSEKPFKLLVIQEDNVIPIEQSNLVEGNIRLRDFLVGNEFDRKLVIKINNISLELSHLALKDYKGKVQINSGFKIWAEDARKKEYSINNEVWSAKSKEEKNKLRSNFYSKYFNDEKSETHSLHYIEYKKLDKFKIKGISSFISEISKFDRPRVDIYKGQKILLSRFGEVTAVFSDTLLYFNTDILVIKLKNNDLTHLVLAILNSKLTTYYMYTQLKKRIDGKFSKIDVSDIKQIRIPQNIDNHLAKKISGLGRELSNGHSEYSEKEGELNELIFDLYELSYWERQRVKDYFLSKEKIGRNKTALNDYKSTLKEMLGFYFKNPITIKESDTGFNLKVIKVSFNIVDDAPEESKVQKYILNEIFEQNPHENFLASQEKIYGKDCVYIIKENVNINWTETKAFEDGQDLLRHIIPD